jgi:hypothetical protein
LARVAFAVEARDQLNGAAHNPKEQRVWKTQVPGAADISVTTGNRWGAAATRAMTFSTSVMKRSGQLRIADSVPITHVDQLSQCSEAEDN